MPEIRAMVATGKMQRGIAEHFGFQDKEVIHNALTRERKKEAGFAAGIVPRKKGRSNKDAIPRDIVAEQAYEIKRLKMENELLQDFLRSAGRE